MRRMSNLTVTETKRTTEQERIIGSVNGDSGGPTVLVLAGIHGNEQAGVKAVSEVIRKLKTDCPAFRGQVIGIRGNVTALKHGVRYVDEDMNRIWFPSVIETIRKTRENELESSERVELKRLLPLIDEILSSVEDTPVLFVDLHTFSAEGWMFMLTAPERKQTDLLSELQVPMVFGIEETLKGTALEYYKRRGLFSFGLEGGQHTHELTVYNTAASLMLLLYAAGCIDKKQVPDIERYREHLRDHTLNLPEKSELVYQHIIEPGDRFRMRPGFKNFQPVKKGEWLATDSEGKIHAQCDGYILMPLYQKQGNDGFFIIREHDS